MRYFPYRNSYLFVFLFWSLPLFGFDKFFQRDHLNSVGIFFQWIAGNIVLESLAIHHLRLVSVKIVNFDRTGTINVLNDEWSFPFRE